MPYFLRPATFVDDGERRGDGGPAHAARERRGGTRIFGAPLAQVSAGASGGSATLDFQVSVEPVPFPARNVVALLPGSDPVLKNQYVAIGAHNDHVGMNARPVDHDSLRLYNHIVRPGGAEDSRNQASPEQQAEVNRQLAEWRAAHPNSARLDTIYNGADDDGSGSVSVLEIAESFAKSAQKPKRSILFVWHVGEEKGLLGSAWFTDHPTVPRDSIVAQLNMDMVGRGNAWDVTGQSKAGEPLHGSDSYLQLVGSRRLSKELGDIVEQVNTSRQVRLHLRLRHGCQRAPDEHLLPQRSLRVRALRHPDHLLHHRRAFRLPPGDRRAAVHRLRAHGAGGPTGGGDRASHRQPGSPHRGRRAEAGSGWPLPAVSGTPGILRSR